MAANNNDKAGKRSEIIDSLADAFDPDDFAGLIKKANDNTRLRAYLDIVRLLSYNTKGMKDDSKQGKLEKIINDMFNDNNTD